MDDRDLLRRAADSAEGAHEMISVLSNSLDLPWRSPKEQATDEGRGYLFRNHSWPLEAEIESLLIQGLEDMTCAFEQQGLDCKRQRWPQCRPTRFRRSRSGMSALEKSNRNWF